MNDLLFYKIKSLLDFYVILFILTKNRKNFFIEDNFLSDNFSEKIISTT